MSQQEVQTFTFEDDGVIPNNKDLPLLIYQGAIDGKTDKCQEIFHDNNWKNNWKGGVFGYHHFHSNSHEVLGVVSGSAVLTLGGKNGRELPIKEGDVLIIPAGVGHKNNEASKDFQVVGGYPFGEDYDLKTGDGQEHEQALENIPHARLPNFDPVYGNRGAIHDHWNISAS
ncbi:cupin domain-containing protein [Thalassobacillus sp. CUG 92003]|uniref:cupin domain-containing protein n=1 Tax=Thalassobacillus sp. CUG 92003 TaxID=2736641 RepID=UPI0015E73CD1|nr:cupin domain-containing protein [Thalassobacillus sp. CUG 92003]